MSNLGYYYKRMVKQQEVEGFGGEEWEGSASCWQFALGLNCSGTMLIGDIIGERVTASQIRKKGIYVLKYTVFEELDYLGFMYEESPDEYDLPEDAAFKLAIMVSPEGMYHVMKMFPNGEWWRKWNGVQPTNIGPMTGHRILSPTHECTDDYEYFFVDVYF